MDRCTRANGTIPKTAKKDMARKCGQMAVFMRVFGMTTKQTAMAESLSLTETYTRVNGLMTWRMESVAISTQKAPHTTDSGTRINRREGVDLSGRMGHSTMAHTKTANVMAKALFNGLMGVIILESGVTTKCTAQVNSAGQTAEYIQETTPMTKSMDKVFIRGRMVGATKAYSTKEGSTARAFTCSQMERRFMGCGTWVKKLAYSTMNRTS